jgi:hypothetical protein
MATTSHISNLIALEDAASKYRWYVCIAQENRPNGHYHCARVREETALRARTTMPQTTVSIPIATWIPTVLDTMLIRRELKPTFEHVDSFEKKNPMAAVFDVGTAAPATAAAAPKGSQA